MGERATVMMRTHMLFSISIVLAFVSLPLSIGEPALQGLLPGFGLGVEGDSRREGMGLLFRKI